jgi:hypothetical protein
MLVEWEKRRQLSIQYDEIDAVANPYSVSVVLK